MTVSPVADPMTAEVDPALPPDSPAHLRRRRMTDVAEVFDQEPDTMLKWATRGVRNHAGERVKLRALRLGGRWYTSVYDVMRFIRDTAAARGA